MVVCIDSPYTNIPLPYPTLPAPLPPKGHTGSPKIEIKTAIGCEEKLM